MITRITIISGKSDSPVSKVKPETFFVAHPLWARDIENMGPWNSEDSEYRPYATWLSGARKGVPVAICGPCKSSFDVAWYLNSLEDLPEWGSVLALEQQTGRGQVRREWVSPPGNIYGVIKWPELPKPKEGEGRPIWTRILPLVVGDLLCKALASFGVEISLKWPNDLLINNKKAGGILIEERDGSTMVGVGLNLASAPETSQLRPDSSIPAVKINTDKMQLSPLETWAEIVTYLKGSFKEIITNQEPDIFLDKLARKLVWSGSEVRVVDGPKGLDRGVITGLCSDGGLILEKDGQEHCLYSGSVMPLKQ